MLKRTIEISREPAHLLVRDRQLLILRKTEPPRHVPANPPNLAPGGRVPCEDIALVMVDERQTTYSHSALVTLAAGGAAVCFCGEDHLPAGMLLPLGDHSQIVWRLRDQIRVRKPVRKQLWKTIIQAKLRAQAALLASIDHEDARAGAAKLRALARETRSGDPDNTEAQGAKIYWTVWMADHWRPPSPDSPHTFNRIAKPGLDAPPPNAMLNYGYAVLRAGMARALVAAGLLPALGIHHRHRANAFCLADDLIEPLRPMVDARVRSLWGRGWTRDDMPQTVKADLLGVLTDAAQTIDGSASTPAAREPDIGPLMVTLHRCTASLAQCYAGERAAEALLIPIRADGS
ncbi:MAG: type II CRISPR-associated endonuclease Cas1 [Phycisphaerales bacterium]|nr:type II CRISPR-associated endonuclease Cas1 [Phycisphaerales bacterium]